MFMRVNRCGAAFCVAVGLVFAFLSLLPGRAAADSALRLEAGTTASASGDSLDNPGLTLGGALALTRWAPLANLAFVPELELLFARRSASVASDATGDASYAMDSIELPLLLRTEMTLGSRSFYALAGGYGSVLLRAQRTNADGIVEHADTASSVDAGFLAGGGLELTSFAGGELFVELRYQRGYRALLLDSGNQEALSLLLGYGLGADTSSSSRAPGRHAPRARDRRLALKAGLVATRLRAPGRVAATHSPGFSLGGAFSPARVGSRIALAPQLEWAFVHRSAHHSEPASGALALDAIDISMLVRGELAMAGGAVYGLGGVYGSILLRAQRTRDDVITDIRDTVSAIDAGWLAGAGVELPSFAGATLSLELRYQRGVRDLFPAGPDHTTQQSISCLLGLTYGHPSSSRAPSLPNQERPSREILAELDILAARLTRLIAAMEATAPATQWSRGGASSCHARAAAPGVLAMPAECTTEEAERQTRDALRTVLLALTRDISALVERLRPIARRQPGDVHWLRLYGEFLGPTLEYVELLVMDLRTSKELIEGADLQRPNEWAWQQAGRDYENALVGAQVLSLWVSWLELARYLHLGTTLSIEWIFTNTHHAWKEMEPVLDQLQDVRERKRRAAARIAQSKLPAWQDALAKWAGEAERRVHETQALVEKLLLIQAVFEVAATHQVASPVVGRAGAFAFVLPGIGGITAGGAATGARVVINAEWVRAMQHLIAIGAITTVEIAKIAGVSALEMSAGPKPGSAGGPGSGKRFPEKVKDTAENQADGKCVFCGKKTTREPGPEQRNTDHAIPKSRGGNNTLDNAQNTCRTCNLKKGKKTTDEVLQKQTGQ